MWTQAVPFLLEKVVSIEELGKVAACDGRDPFDIFAFAELEAADFSPF
jgi:hypothetical protein